MAKQRANIQRWLLPLSWLYEKVTTIRNRLYDKGRLQSRSFHLPVICVGNLTVGGTGKTPHTEYLIRLLAPLYRVAVLSRGYRRKSSGFVLSTPTTPTNLIGDEPYQMKQKFPHVQVAVDGDRCRGIDKLLSPTILPDTPQVILLDDAYQHRSVRAGLNILLVNYQRPIWNDTLLPAGRLRESVQGLRRAQVIIITKCPTDITPPLFAEYTAKLHLTPTQQLFFSTVAYGRLTSLFGRQSMELDSITPAHTVILFTGIASPLSLKEEMLRHTPQVILLQHPDHHYFTASDFKELQNRFAAIQGDKVIVTTEKDASRLIQDTDSIPSAIKPHIYTIGIEIKILRNQQQKFNKLILQYVAQENK